MTNKTFLIEIGTEELPPTQLLSISTDFKEGFEKALAESEISFSTIKTYATPRRIALLVEELAEKAVSKIVEKRGPAKAACFDNDGNLSKAALGWLKSNNAEFEQTSFISTDKGDYLYYRFEQEGQYSKDLLLTFVQKAISNIKIAKGMRWGNNNFEFIRPVKTFTMLLDNQVIDGEIFGVKSDRVIFGHRFLGAKTIPLNHANEYERRLREEGSVIASFAERKEIIITDAKKYASQLGGVIKVDDDLLDEITSLVELPKVMVANFEKEFLEVPKEALIHTMEGDQRYFPVYTNEQCEALLPHFIFVSNIDPKDPSKVISGNEKVIRPRLTDAKFFYKQDLKRPLSQLLPLLKKVVFQNQLGTVYDKTLRLVELAKYLAPQLNGNDEYAERAALLSKCDLMTNMVFEFTDTQGIMGMYYARKFNEAEEVAQSLYEQYLPKFSGGELPKTTTGSILSLADKVDTLVGIFGINQPPKGAKDPFALRRAAISILRILAEGKYDVDLTAVITKAIDIYGDKLTVAKEILITEILEFINNRVKSLYEEQGFTSDELQSVIALNVNNPYDFYLRLQAIKEFKNNEASLDLVAANKRVKNFLSKSAVDCTVTVDPSLFELTEEKNLFQVVSDLENQCQEFQDKREYLKLLTLLATCRETLNVFFDNVIVNADNTAIKNNRYALLVKLNNLCSSVADLSCLVINQ